MERESEFAGDVDEEADVSAETVAVESKDESEVPQYQGAFPSHPRFLLLLFDLCFSISSFVLALALVEVVVPSSAVIVLRSVAMLSFS